MLQNHFGEGGGAVSCGGRQRGRSASASVLAGDRHDRWFRCLCRVCVLCGGLFALGVGGGGCAVPPDGGGNMNAGGDGTGGGSGGNDGAGGLAAVMAVRLEPVAEGFTSPVYLTHAGDGSGRLFVVDQVGLVRVIDADGNLLDTPFLDLTDTVVALNPGFDERGLLGLAFHPNYAQNGRFFVRYSAPRNGGLDEPCNDPNGFIVGCHEEVLAEFAVAGDPVTGNVADPSSQRVLFRIDEPQFNHNAGQVIFGPDGLLYFSLGDGGGANDGLADDPPSHGPGGNGQNIDTVLGSLLRIDVDRPPEPGLAYAIPADNPFAGGPGADEIYAYGFRNPYRFSFDDGPAGDNALYVADVGQDLFEEVDIVERGGNYGWVIREGMHCFDPLDPSNPPAGCADTGSLGEPLRAPVLEYDHSVGLAVIGGFVYRGADYPELVGKYVFGDFGRSFSSPSGVLFYTDITGPGAFELQTFQVAPDNQPLELVVLGIGRDQAGELYLLGSRSTGPVGADGVVMRLAAP